jgi:hypothetical protein
VPDTSIAQTDPVAAARAAWQEVARRIGDHIDACNDGCFNSPKLCPMGIALHNVESTVWCAFEDARRAKRGTP